MREACALAEAWRPHYQRYCETLELLSHSYTGGLIVDVGGESPFTTALRSLYGPDQVHVTADAELREGSVLPGCEPGSASYITFLEVIEQCLYISVHDV